MLFKAADKFSVEDFHK